MKKKFLTLLMGILAFGLVNAQTVIFDPATYEGDLLDGMEIIEMDGAKYLQIIVDGWNTTLNIPEVANIEGNAFSGMVAYSQGSSTVAAGLTLADINSVVQLMDTINTVPPSWDPNSLVPVNTQLYEGPTTEGMKYRKASITDGQEFVHQIQFFGQETKTWGPVVGDTIIVGRIASFDATVLFDPATLDASSLPADMEIVEEGGVKLLKVKLNGWSTNLPIVPFEVGKNNKMSMQVKYEAGESGLDNANAQCFVQAMDEAGALFNATVSPAPADLTAVEADAKANSVVSSLQLAVQETSGNWDAVVGAYLYLGKITVSYAEAVLAEAPNTAKLAYSVEAKDITIDGLYDDAYGEVANIVNREALNSTGSPIVEEDSYGEWLAVADLENFYFYIEVNDNDPIELGESTSPWMNDGVELFLDIQNRRFEGSSRIAGEQQQMRINYGTEGPAKPDFGMESFYTDSDTTNIEFAIISSSGGYVIEARIPWATWYRTNANTAQDALDAIDLNEGMKIAFEVSILDAESVDGRKSILNWANNTGEDQAYKTNEFWGEVTLEGGWPVGVFEKVEKTALVVYPNPASTQITVEMENVKSIVIYNIIGAKVYDSNDANISTIDVSNLNQGVYVVRATDFAGKTAVTKFNKN